MNHPTKPMLESVLQDAADASLELFDALMEGKCEFDPEAAQSIINAACSLVRLVDDEFKKVPAIVGVAVEGGGA